MNISGELPISHAGVRLVGARASLFIQITAFSTHGLFPKWSLRIQSALHRWWRCNQRTCTHTQWQKWSRRSAFYIDAVYTSIWLPADLPMILLASATRLRMTGDISAWWNTHPSFVTFWLRSIH